MSPYGITRPQRDLSGRKAFVITSCVPKMYWPMNKQLRNEHLCFSSEIIWLFTTKCQWYYKDGWSHVKRKYLSIIIKVLLKSIIYVKTIQSKIMNTSHGMLSLNKETNNNLLGDHKSGNIKCSTWVKGKTAVWVYDTIYSIWKCDWSSFLRWQLFISGGWTKGS